MKIRGADFIRWYDHGFPEGHFWDSDDEYLHNADGSWKLDPATTYNTSDLGYLCLNDSKDDVDTDAIIRKWLKGQSTTLLVVAVPKEQEAAMRAAISGLGCKIEN